MRAVTQRRVEEQLQEGVIDPAWSEWAIPVVLEPKKDRNLRFVVDYRLLNLATIYYTYPLPRLGECIDRIGNASIFSMLGSNCVHCKIPVADGYKYKRFFTTQSRTFRYIRIPFGLRKAPATFHRAFYIILSGVRWQS